MSDVTVDSVNEVHISLLRVIPQHTFTLGLLC